MNSTSKLTPQQRERLISRLATGKLKITYNNIVYTIHPPTPDIIYDAGYYADEKVESVRFSNWPTKESIVDILIKKGLWTKDGDANIKAIDKRIEDLKVELYNAYLKSDAREKIRATLNAVRSKQEEMLGRRHSLDHTTIEGYGEMLKQQYIIANTLYFGGSRVWPCIEAADVNLMNSAKRQLDESRLSIEVCRDLARNDPWRSMWNINKNPFNIFPAYMTEEQKVITLFSRMYDSVMESSESPPDDVIDDDDMLDGWLIFNKRKNEKNKNAASIDAQYNIKGNPQEVFLFGQTKEDANKINALNDTNAQIVKAQRSNLIKKQGTVKEAELPDNVQKIQQQVNTKISQRKS